MSSVPRFSAARLSLRRSTRGGAGSIVVIVIVVVAVVLVVADILGYLPFFGSP